MLNPRKLLPTLCLCVPTALVCSRPMLGMLLELAVLLAMVGLTWSGYRAWRRPADRPWRAASAAMIVVALLIPAGLQRHYWTDARRTADAAATGVERFRQRHGRYPADIAEMGWPERNTPQFHYGYDLLRGKPSLYYRDTFRFFYVYQYDFARRRWWLHD